MKGLFKGSVALGSALILVTFLFACQGTEKKAEDLNNEGVYFLDKEEYAKAGSCFFTALKTEEISAELKSGILRNLSLMYSARGMRDSALVFAADAMHTAPKDSYFYNLSRAEFALLKRNINEAISYFENAKKLRDDEMAIYNSLGMIYSGKYGIRYENLPKALINNKKAYELSQREPLAEALALSYMNLDQYKESLPIWKKLTEMNPSKMEYMFQEGVALYFSGHQIEGEEKMQRAADRDENCRRMLNEMISE